MTGSNHLRPRRLFDISQGKERTTEEERKHVRECEECKAVIVIFARQFPPEDAAEAQSA
jgi:hypothetical protein